MLKPGDQAPDFALPTAEMSILDTRDFRGKKNLVIYFYPKDDTPGCTMEAIDFSELNEAFAALDTVVLGISRDTCITHAAFRDKYGLTVELVADPEGQTCSAFGVLQEREKDGVVKTVIQRSTFIIDKAGIVRHVWYGVTPKGHAEQVLEQVQALYREQ